MFEGEEYDSKLNMDDDESSIPQKAKKKKSSKTKYSRRSKAKLRQQRKSKIEANANKTKDTIYSDDDEDEDDEYQNKESQINKSKNIRKKVIRKRNKHPNNLTINNKTNNKKIKSEEIDSIQTNTKKKQKDIFELNYIEKSKDRIQPETPLSNSVVLLKNNNESDEGNKGNNTKIRSNGVNKNQTNNIFSNQIIKKDKTKGQEANSSINKLKDKFNLKISIPLSENDNNQIRFNMPINDLKNDKPNIDIDSLKRNQNSNSGAMNANNSGNNNNDNEVNLSYRINGNTNTISSINSIKSNINNDKANFLSNKSNNDHIFRNPTMKAYEILSVIPKQKIPQSTAIISNDRDNTLQINNYNHFTNLSNNHNNSIAQSPFGYESHPMNSNQIQMNHTRSRPLSSYNDMIKIMSPPKKRDLDNQVYNFGNIFEFPRGNESNEMLKQKRYRDDLYTISPLPFNPHQYFPDYFSGNNYKKMLPSLPSTPNSNNGCFDYMDESILNNSMFNNNALNQYQNCPYNGSLININSDTNKNDFISTPLPGNFFNWASNTFNQNDLNK